MTELSEEPEVIVVTEIIQLIGKRDQLQKKDQVYWGF